MIRQLPKRSLLSAWFLLALFMLALPARAQPILDVEPDTLRFPTEREALLQNVGTAPLRLDSVGITPWTGFAWFVHIGGPAGDILELNADLDPVRPIDVTVEVDSLLTLIVGGWNSCVPCKRSPVSDSLWIADTLFVYSSDPAGVAEPELHKVYLDVSRWRSDVDPVAMPEDVVIEVFPNPFAREARVWITSLATAQRRLVVYDVLGRRVAEQAVRGASEEQRLLLPEGAPPGLYVLHVQEAGRVVATRRLVKLR